MDLVPGSEFAGYRIESVLGRGGMGVVYLAEHVGMGRKVALKVLAPDLLEDERFRERFVRESRLAASLEHPNIVPIHEAGEVGGVLYIAMRYVEGTDLRNLLRDQGALEPDRAASIVTQVASALDAAHERGLVHRDIKPGNVLVANRTGSSGEHVYLADFGLTKRTSSDSGITGTGQFVGTLEYAAPEQFEGKTLDARTDVYSLGCLLFECLTGQPPFQRETDAALIYAHLREPPPSATSAQPELPAAIDSVIARAMAKAPSDRNESAGALAASARRALTPSDREGGVPSGARSRRGVLAAVAALGAVVVAIVVTLMLSGGGGGPGAPSSPSTAVGPPLASVVEIDPSTGKIVTTVSELHLVVGQAQVPAHIAVGEGSVWVLDGINVTRVDPETRTSEESLPYRGSAGFGFVRAIDVGLGDVVISDIGTRLTSGALARIDPATLRIHTYDLPNVGPATGLVIGTGAIWETFGGGILLRIDPRTFEAVDRFDLGGSLDAVAADEEIVWVGDELAATVSSIDPSSREVSEPIRVNGIDQLAAAGTSVWVLDAESGTVTEVDASSGIGQAIRVGDDPSNMVAGLGAIWISDRGGAVWRVDTVTGEATSIQIGSPLAGIAVDESRGTVWALVH
jgi:streptogramin lyase/predicted Ser/Thr protein kinase